MDGDGQLQQLAWTTGQDGILVMDLDGSGAIESGREMFSPWFNDGDFEHALDALASLDSNGDGVIDAQDDALSQLKVWVDANGDGVSDAGELFSLTDLGIASIGLNTASGGDPIDGQTVLGLAAMAMTSSMAGRATTYSPAAPGRTSS